MRFLRSLRVGVRLAIGFGFLAAVMVVLGINLSARLGGLARQLNDMDKVRVQKLEDTTALATLAHQDSRAMVQQFLATEHFNIPTDPVGQAKWEKVQLDHLPRYDELYNEIDKLVENAEERALFDDLNKLRVEFFKTRTKAREILKGPNGYAAGTAYIGEVNPLQNKYDKTLDNLHQFEWEQVHKAARDGESFSKKTVTIAVIVLILAVLAAMGLWFLIARGITRPLLAAVSDASRIAEGRFQMTSVDELGQVSEAFAFVQAILAETVELKDRVQRENHELQSNIMELLTVVADAAEGDLTVRAKVTTGALGNVADAFNSLLEALQVLMGRVAKQIDQTNQTVNLITASSSRMAAGATTQANEVQAAKRLVEKSTEDIKRVGHAAESAADAARNTESSASEGAHAIENIVNGMEQLRQNVQAGAKKMKNLGDRSMEINGIVDTISRISEQTNMLALNAAIEAARAGEHGRGFSVVADEVRKLAERTANATQEIAKLVTAISQETNETVAAIEKQTQVVEQESALVTRAGKALIKIREVSSESASLVTGISSLTKAQIEGSTVVGKAIAEISQIAQATLQGVEGTVTTLSQLTRLSTELTQSMARFKVN
jgi:methyl-accepting chemotaxis protein